MNSLALAILAAIVLSGVLGLYLLYRQAAAVAANRERVPAGFAGAISGEEHQRAAAYTLARTRLAMAQTAFDTLIAVVWLTVLLGPLYEGVARWIAPGLSCSVGVVVVFALAERLLQLPFSIFSTFGLEARFGFNRGRPPMFLLDRIKGAALSAAAWRPAALRFVLAAAPAAGLLVACSAGRLSWF